MERQMIASHAARAEISGDTTLAEFDWWCAGGGDVVDTFKADIGIRAGRSRRSATPRGGRGRSTRAAAGAAGGTTPRPYRKQRTTGLTPADDFYSGGLGACGGNHDHPRSARRACRGAVVKQHRRGRGPKAVIDYVST
jgi:hypothetical protein